MLLTQLARVRPSPGTGQTGPAGVWMVKAQQVPGGGPKAQTQTRPSPRTCSFVPGVTRTMQAGDIPLHSGDPASLPPAKPLGLSRLQRGVRMGHREWSEKHRQDALEVKSPFLQQPQMQTLTPGAFIKPNNAFG